MYSLIKKKKQDDKYLKSAVKGAKFLKHGRSGKPHPRFVSTTPAYDTILYKELNGSSKAKKNQLSAHDFEHVEKGITTKVLQRTKKLDPKLCLSLVGPARTLDLECANEIERDEWFEIFSCIVDIAQQKKTDEVQYQQTVDDLTKVLKVLSTFTFDIDSTTWKVSKVLTKNTKFSDDDMNYLAYALDENFVLSFLDLNGINLTGVGLANICQSLNSATSLTTLILNENSVGDDGLTHLAKALAQNKSIKLLDLRDNNITDRGVEELGHALQDNSTLEELLLDNNHIADEGGVMLAESLKEHKSLKTLSVNDNQISNEGAQKLAMVLESNKSKLETLRIARNMIVFPDINHEDENRDTELEISLFMAVDENNYGKVILLTIKGADPNVQNDEDGATPLHISASRGSMQMIEFLLDHPTIDVNVRDESGATALFCAMANRQYEVVKALLEKKADSHIGNNDRKTVLHLAAEQGNKVLVKTLIEQYNHDLNVVTKDELTPLHLASQNLHRPVMEYLLQKDEEERKEFNSKNTDIDPDDIIAYVNWQDVLGETSLHKVFNNGKIDIDCAKLLVQRGADVSLGNNNGINPIQNASDEVKRILLQESFLSKANNKA